MATFIGPTIGGPLRTSEEIGEGADVAEGLEGGVQVAVVGDVAESASMRCCALILMHLMHRCCHTTYIAWRVGLQLLGAPKVR